MALEGGGVQNQSPQLEIRCGISAGGEILLRSLGSGQWGPWECGWGEPLREEAGWSSCPSQLCVPQLLSRLLLTLRPTSLAAGDEVELLCEAQRGSPPILYSFHLNGDVLRNHVAPHGGPASCPFRVMSQQDAGDYFCEAGNRVSRETSKSETLSWMVGLVPQLVSEPQQADRGQTSLLCVPLPMPHAGPRGGGRWHRRRRTSGHMKISSKMGPIFTVTDVVDSLENRFLGSHQI